MQGSDQEQATRRRPDEDALGSHMEGGPERGGWEEGKSQIGTSGIHRQGSGDTEDRVTDTFAEIQDEDVPNGS